MKIRPNNPRSALYLMAVTSEPSGPIVLRGRKAERLLGELAVLTGNTTFLWVLTGNTLVKGET